MILFYCMTVIKVRVEAGLRIVDILQEEGFVFVTVDELLLN